METPGSFIVAVAAVLTAAWVIGTRVWGLARWVWRLGQSLHDLVEDWYGDMTNENPGVIGRLVRIEHQIHPNDGGSVADSVYRTEKLVAKNHSRLTALENRMTVDELRFDELVRRVEQLHPDSKEH